MNTYTTGVFRLGLTPLVLLLAASTQVAPRTFSQTLPVRVTLTPGSAAVPFGTTVQFKAAVANTTNMGIRWFVNDSPGGNALIGTIGADGLYTAPTQHPSPSAVLVKAISMADPNAVAMSLVRFQHLRLTITPDRSTLRTGEKQQFTAKVDGSANQQVKWLVNDIAGGNATLGTISVAGLYTAPAAEPTPALVRIRATSIADPEATDLAAAIIQNQSVKITVTPARSEIWVGDKQQFSAKVDGSANQSVKWYVNDIAGGNAAVGLIGATGLYTSPARQPSPSTVRVKAVSLADLDSSDSRALVVQNLKVTVSPERASLKPGEKQQFAARVTGPPTPNQQVKWLVNDVPGGSDALGSINAAGLYTAPAKAPSPATLRVKAISVADPDAADGSNVTIQAAPAIKLTLTPSSTSVRTGAMKQFTATVENSTNKEVKWFVNDVAGGNETVGMIDAAGLYKAPAKVPSPAMARVKAVSVADAQAMDTSTVTIQAEVNVSVNVTPDTANVVTGATKQFTAAVENTANKEVKWFVNDVAGGNDAVGSITAAGLYKAPAKTPSPAVVKIKAASVADAQAMDTSMVTIMAEVSVTVNVTPDTANVATGATKQFAATVENTTNKKVEWYVNDVEGGNDSVGTISAAGLYKAPAKMPTPATVKIKAVSEVDEKAMDTSTVTITAAVSVKVTVAPDAASVRTGATQQFKATVEGSTNTGVKWLVNDVAGGDDTNGKITGAGLYTAPAKVPATAAVKIKAVSDADASAFGLATATVQATPDVTLTLTPDTITVFTAQTQQFKATVTNATNTDVKWYVNDIAGGNTALGSINATGMYTAPAALPNPPTVTIKAVSVALATATDTSVITIQTVTLDTLTVTPTAVQPGAFTLTVRGSAFVPSTTAAFAGVNATVTLVSPTELRVAGNTPAGKLGDMVLTVSNPSPNASTRAALVEVRSYQGDPRVNLRDAHRILRQGTFGPSPESMDRLQAIGFDAWLTEQLAGAQPGAYPASLDNEGSLEPLEERFMRLAVTWPDQLRLKTAWILSQIFVVSGVEVSRAEPMVSYQRMLYDNALGNFATILRTVALHPAMGEYLDNVNNGKADAARGIVPNENFARESMQLLTVGVQKLQINGVPMLGANGVPVPTYDQSVVMGLTRALTGWTYTDGRAGAPTNWQSENYTGLMEPVERYHDTGEKILMDGFRIPPNQTAEQDLTSALNHLFTHANVGPFIGRQFIQHLVTSNPSPDYIARVAARFNDNGAGVRGDMKALLRAVLTDPEAAASGSPGFGHMREPVAFIAAQLRPLRPNITDYPFTTDLVADMAQHVFYSPSVFNYYSPNFRPAGATFFAPEFQLFNTATATIRANFTSDLVTDGFSGSITPDYTPFIHGAMDPVFLVDLIDRGIMGQQMAPEMKTAISDAVRQITNNNRLRVQLALYLAFTSQQFQVEH